jgi:hypothetical protein
MIAARVQAADIVPNHQILRLEEPGNNAIASFPLAPTAADLMGPPTGVRCGRLERLVYRSVTRTTLPRSEVMVRVRPRSNGWA